MQCGYVVNFLQILCERHVLRGRVYSLIWALIQSLQLYIVSRYNGIGNKLLQCTQVKLFQTIKPSVYILYVHLQHYQISAVLHMPISFIQTQRRLLLWNTECNVRAYILWSENTLLYVSKILWDKRRIIWLPTYSMILFCKSSLWCLCVFAFCVLLRCVLLQRTTLWRYTMIQRDWIRWQSLLINRILISWLLRDFHENGVILVQQMDEEDMCCIYV